MSNGGAGYPSERHVKRGDRSVRGGEKELLEKLGNDDLCPCVGAAGSRVAVETAAAFDGSGRLRPAGG
jgi:hypothetical protein